MPPDQGLAAFLLAPATVEYQQVGLTLVPAAARGRTMGNISIVISIAPAIGPTISGIILNALSWRFMLIIVWPVATLNPMWRISETRSSPLYPA